MRPSRVFAGVLWILAVASSPGFAEVIAVRYTEGLVHGFLTLRSAEGAVLADGELIQFARADRVTSRLLLRFRDGSLHDETTVFSQSSNFRLISEHMVQKGPAFKQPVDLSIDAASGSVKVVYPDDGKIKTVTERMELPPDLANGMVLILLKNLDPRKPLTTVSMVAAAPKPRLVKLAIAPAGDDPFTAGNGQRKATHYVVHVELGGVAGIVAPLIGKQPPDTHVWVLQGDAPGFLGSDGPLATGGPPWRLELAAPGFPAASGRTR